MILMNISAGCRPATAAGTAALLLVLAGCGSDDGGGTEAEGPTVVAGFYPLEWAAEQIGGDRIEVSSLTAPGAEPHDLELTPREVAGVADADLLVYLGGFQAAVDEAAESQAGDHSWDVAEAADLSLTAEDHDHDHDHGEESADPHFWLDPTRLADVGDALAEQLADIDPDGAETYEQNAATLREKLEALDREMAEGLTGCRVDTLVTSHDAFGYLAHRYGLEVVGVTGLSPSTEPSADQLAEIADLVRERGVTTVYTETLADPSVAETVADEAGVRTAVLDPIEGLTDESAGDDYLAVMRANLATLQEGQACS
jgi:zinc transport system substrate-binding protein